MKVNCYVCNGPVDIVTALYIGGGLYRHKSKCRPGGAEWINAPVSKKGINKELRELFLKTIKG